jgi:hypothetical protein
MPKGIRTTGGSKVCSGVCGQTKPLTDFYRAGRSYFGRCKQCTTQINASKRVRYGPKKTSLEISGNKEKAQELLDNGASLISVASELKVSPNTVRNYLKRGFLVINNFDDNDDATNASESGK